MGTSTYRGDQADFIAGGKALVRVGILGVDGNNNIHAGRSEAGKPLSNRRGEVGYGCRVGDLYLAEAAPGPFPVESEEMNINQHLTSVSLYRGSVDRKYTQGGGGVSSRDSERATGYIFIFFSPER